MTAYINERLQLSIQCDHGTTVGSQRYGESQGEAKLRLLRVHANDCGSRATCGILALLEDWEERVG